MEIINTLAPVFLIMILGASLVRGGLISPGLVKEFNRVAYWVALPAFLFHTMATATYETGPAGRILIVVLAGTFGGILAAWIVAKAMRAPSRSVGTFIQATFRGNLAFVGLPIILYSLEGRGESVSAAIETAVILAFAPAMLVYNVVAVLVLLIGSGEGHRGMIGRTTRQLISNPLVISTLAGILYANTGWPLPDFLDRSLGAVSRMALPLALICIGGTLVVVRVTGSLRLALGAAVLKVAMVPLIGFLAALVFGIDGDELQAAMILLACPTAAASFVLTQQLFGDEALASSAIVLSTILSFFSLSVIVWLF